MVLPVHHAKSSVKSPIPAFAASRLRRDYGLKADPLSRPRPPSGARAAPLCSGGAIIGRRHYYAPLMGRSVGPRPQRAGGGRLVWGSAVPSLSPQLPQTPPQPLVV